MTLYFNTKNLFILVCLQQLFYIQSLKEVVKWIKPLFYY